MCIAGALNPKGMILVLISAAASTFGGTSGLLWATNWLKRGTLIPYGPAAEPLPIRRNWSAGGSGLCGRDCFHRRVRPERPVGALKLWAPFSPIG
jgi:hypothetical protein